MDSNILILLTIAVTAASSQSLPPGLVTTVISDLLAPNTRPVVINKRNIQKPVGRLAITDLPKTAEPKRVIIKNANGLFPNNGIVIQKPEAGNKNVILHKGAVADKIILNQKPVLKPMDGVKTVVIRKEVPRRVVVNEAVVSPQFVPKQVQQKVVPVQQKVVPVQQKVVPVQQKVVPVQQKLVPVQQKVVITEPRNMYPVKALPKKPKVLVPNPPQSSGRFLRKIPIPPPTI